MNRLQLHAKHSGTSLNIGILKLEMLDVISRCIIPNLLHLVKIKISYRIVENPVQDCSLLIFTMQI